MHGGRVDGRARARARRRRRVAGLVALGAVNIGVLGTDVYLLSQRNVTRPVTLHTALQQFRAGQARAVSTATSVAAARTRPPVAPTAAATGSATHPPSVASPQPPVPTAAATPTVAAPFGLPAEGVYSYRTSGGEKVNILDASHRYPSVTYATVRHLPACGWQIENDVIQEHTDRRDLCNSPGQLAEIDQSRIISFFGQTDGATLTCSPQLVLMKVGEPVGTPHDGVCHDGKGTVAHIHAVDLGIEQVSVDGAVVRVVHTVLDSRMTGRVVGTAHDDLQALATTGMTVAWNRSVDTVADTSFGAKAHYTERAQFQLVSLTPQT